MAVARSQTRTVFSHVGLRGRLISTRTVGEIPRDAPLWKKAAFRRTPSTMRRRRVRSAACSVSKRARLPSGRVTTLSGRNALSSPSGVVCGTFAAAPIASCEGAQSMIVTS